LVSDPNFVRVGKVKDAHGIKGELFLLLFASEAAWLGELESLRLVNEASGVVKTFTPKSVRTHKNGLIAKTEEIKDRNEAEALKGWLMEIPAALFVSEKGESIYLREIDGFKVFTDAPEAIGMITGFGSNTVQDLLQIKTATGEYEVPFVDAFVKKIDYEKKEIHLDLPFGLLGEALEDGEQ
jgi:16S rRNA processing protein RimM